MKKIILLIAFSISIVAARAEEFTLSFNNIEIYYGDSLYFSGQANTTVTFNYQNKSGFVHFTFDDDSYTLEPVSDSFDEKDGIQTRKMKASSGKILLVGYDPENETVYLGSKYEGEFLFFIIKNKPDTANSTNYQEKGKTENNHTAPIYNL